VSRSGEIYVSVVTDRYATAKALHDAIKVRVAAKFATSSRPRPNQHVGMANVEVSRDVHDRIEAEARRRGVSISDIVGELAERLPAREHHGDRPTPSFVAAGASDHGITNRIDELLADGFGR